MKTNIKPTLTLFALALGALIGTSALQVYATGTWTAPSTTPPGGQVDAPINAGGGDYPTGDSRNYSQIKTGLLGLAKLVVTNLNVATGTPGFGKVLTDVTGYGDVGWTSLPSSSSGGGGAAPVFITPVTLVNNASTPGGQQDGTWTTISNLIAYGVPTNASAIILETYFSPNNGGDTINMRSGSGGSTYILAKSTVYTSNIGFNQGIYPISSSESFDYSIPHGTYSGLTIRLVGYIPVSSGSSGTVSGTVGGGCYYSVVANAGRNTYSNSSWGNGTVSGSGVCTCPTGYTSQITSSGVYTVTGVPSEGSSICLKN